MYASGVRRPASRVEAQGHLDQLGVDRRTRVADHLHVELAELAVAAGLRAVVAEHRAGHREAHGLRPRLHAVLDVGAHDAGRRLGPERPGLRLVAARGEPEELLLHDVGHVADAALEHGRLLEQRRLDRPEAIAAREVRRDPLEGERARPVGRQDVARAPWGAEGGHGRRV